MYVGVSDQWNLMSLVSDPRRLMSDPLYTWPMTSDVFSLISANYIHMMSDPLCLTNDFWRQVPNMWPILSYVRSPVSENYIWCQVFWCYRCQCSLIPDVWHLTADPLYIKSDAWWSWYSTYVLQTSLYERNLLYCWDLYIYSLYTGTV